MTDTDPLTTLSTNPGDRPQGQSWSTVPTKAADEENFPVGSWLLPARLRPHVATYYAFARAVDDIADDPNRPPDVKIAELNDMEAALRGAACPAEPNPNIRKAMRLNISMCETNVPFDHGADLCTAFRQDAGQSRYDDWVGLMEYCRYSAAPVGRYLLDLHGESHDTWPASDALCASLQVINHLQDCQKDYREMDRVYLPLSFMNAAGATVADLDQPACTPALRHVLDTALNGVDRLNDIACSLPGRIRNRRMRLEAAVIVEIAHRLAKRLRAGDPLQTRIALGRVGKLGSLLGGLRRAF